VGIPDSSSVVMSYLRTVTALTALVGTRIYGLRLPESPTLPAVVFQARGGQANPEIPDLAAPSYQFTCWGGTQREARQVYRALYDGLQGLSNQAVGDNMIVSAVEEVQGQEMIDPDTEWHFVLTFFSLLVR